MAIQKQGFGAPRTIEGALGPRKATAVPLDLLQRLRSFPIPVTIGGTNNVTFTLKGSTRPIALWSGQDLIFLDEDKAYTWGAVSNAILDSAGAAATDADSVLGVWYMYAGIDTTVNPPTIDLRPSQTAPEATAGPYGSGWLGHPGTTKTRFWTYVGFMVCTTAATPAFLAMEKIGRTWHWADLSNPTTATTWTVTSLFSVRIPKLAKYEGMVRGFLETGKAGSVQVSGSSTSIRGAMKAGNQVTSSILFTPFECPNDDTTGELYALHAVAAGDIHVTQYDDAV